MTTFFDISEDMEYKRLQEERTAEERIIDHSTSFPAFSGIPIPNLATTRFISWTIHCYTSRGANQRRLLLITLTSGCWIRGQNLRRVPNRKQRP